MVVLSHTKFSDTEEVTILSGWDISHTSEWLIVKLSELGYDSGENPSAILDGVTFSKSGGRYHSLFTDVNLNAEGQCTVMFKLSP